MLPTAPAVYLSLFMEDTLIYMVVKYDCHAVGKLQHSLIVVAFWCGYWNTEEDEGSTQATCFAGRCKVREGKLKIKWTFENNVKYLGCHLR